MRREDLGIEPSHPVGRGPIVSIREALKGVVPDVENTPKLSGIYGEAWAAVPVGGCAADVLLKGWQGTNKPSPLRPLPTLPKTNLGAGYATLVHWSEPRALTVNELKRLCSYPDDYVLEGTFAERCARLGNSVMPKFMEALARHLRENVLDVAPK
jgi:DNA (cytosine-5)-methyltransferase 1